MTTEQSGQGEDQGMFLNKLLDFVAMISTKFIRFSFDKLARTHKIARSFSPRVLVPKPVPTGSAYVTHAPQEPHFGSDTLPLFDARKWSKYNHTAPCLYNSNSFKAF